MEATAIAPQTASPAPAPARGFDDLGGESFFKLLIAQLTNQDPLEPASNQELLQQISSIRDIELSTALTGSLRSLVDHQRVGSGAALMGQFVSGAAGSESEGAVAVSGVVVGIRFVDGGNPVLRLNSGAELPLDLVDSVMPPAQAAQELVGQEVMGLDRSKPNAPEVRDGVVTGVRSEPDGQVVLELDTGDELSLDDVMSAASLGSTGIPAAAKLPTTLDSSEE